ncbi:helix-turn-helix domain-containing protein [Actinocorallia sp. API 0066]|uniref:helix-turn-helix domain-containing protein n=1 Tax=Actinocorallia sp. API 0066 TaxID=2896846 RepID=UPI001E516652|nr:helix-turn-helix transcriptional regulator [Actinocorallia sp. API 0066]MCD0449041.1 helix-turn-helix domain-containing protein [Actinocorallia sp. API 0066]
MAVDIRAGRQADEEVVDELWPTELRVALGRRMKTYRAGRGLGVAAVAEALQVSPMVIRALEGGYLTKVRNRLVLRMCALYGIDDDDQLSELLELAHAGSSPGWWSAFSDVIPSWFEPYLALEQSADLIRSFDAQFVPGLLQSPDYARAVARGDEGGPEEEVDYRVALRMRRQRRFQEEGGPKLWALLDEAVLLRPMGGRTTMFRQLDYLCTLCDLPNLAVQIVPLAEVGHATGGPVVLLRMPEIELGGPIREIVYLEQLTDASYIDDPDDVLYYRHVLASLSILAPPPSDTQGIIHRRMSEL